jgi:hypothetical protein
VKGREISKGNGKDKYGQSALYVHMNLSLQDLVCCTINICQETRKK